MTEDTRMTNVLESYRSFAKELASKWDNLASGIAEKMDGDEYDGEAMLDAWAKTTRLTAETGIQLWAQALAAAKLLSGEQYERVERCEDFPSPLENATLELEGPLVGQAKGGQLDAQVKPEQLADGETTFVVCADATGFPSDDYFGTVLASRDGESVTVDVWISF